MEVLLLTHPLERPLLIKEPHVMAIGFFDGVHLGHQTLLKKARDLAKKNKVKFAAMTFDPHPSEIINVGKDWKYITPLASKIEKMSCLGVDILFVINFNLSFASLAPIDFIKQYVLGLNTQHIVVGFDFTFGYKAEGTVDYLREVSKCCPFDLTVISKKTYNKEKISTTIIKKIISEGGVHLVPYYLGKHYEIKGTIHLSNQHYLEKPKNLAIQIENKYLLPKPGMYSVEIIKGNKTLPGIFTRYCSVDKCQEISFRGIEWTKEDKMFESKIKFLNMIPFSKEVQIGN